MPYHSFVPAAFSHRCKRKERHAVLENCSLREHSVFLHRWTAASQRRITLAGWIRPLRVGKWIPLILRRPRHVSFKGKWQMSFSTWIDSYFFCSFYWWTLGLLWMTNDGSRGLPQEMNDIVDCYQPNFDLKTCLASHSSKVRGNGLTPLLVLKATYVPICWYNRLMHWWCDWLIVWLIEYLFDWLIDWLIDWLMSERSIDWLIDWMIDWWASDWLIDWLISEWLIDWLIALLFRLMREHNRIAKALAKLNPHWDSAIIFQQARRIVIASLQHITFKEFLPLLMGSRSLDKHRLRLLDHDYYKSYSLTTSGNVDNAVAVSALKFWHKLMDNRVVHIEADGTRSTTMLSKEMYRISQV